MNIAKGGRVLEVNNDNVVIREGFIRTEFPISVVDFKQFFFGVLAGLDFNTYRIQDSALSIRFFGNKVSIRITSGTAQGTFQVFLNEIPGFSSLLRKVHQPEERTHICNDRIEVIRKNDTVFLKSKDNSVEHIFSDESVSFFWGTCLFRVLGITHLGDGIFDRVAIKGDTLRFPFQEEGELFFLFSISDVVKLLSIF
ncbi:hypothetical protein [Desulfurobacterium sp.]